MERDHIREFLAVIPKRIAEGFKENWSGKGGERRRNLPNVKEVEYTIPAIVE